MEGVYVYIHQQELAKCCVSLEQHKSYMLPAYLEIKRAPRTGNMFINFFRELELMDVNLLADNPSVTVECFGATIDTTRQGKVVLNGRFSLTTTIGSAGIEVKINVRGTLVLSNIPGVYTTVSTSGVVPYFKARGTVTMCPDDFTADNVAFARSDNPLFGFFQTPEVKTTDVVKSKSLLSRMTGT
jgi:hypothetical protein